MYEAIKKLFLLSSLSISVTCFAQDISSRLSQGFEAFEKDSQLQNAISSLYVIDAKTGKVVFEKNSSIGLAPASTQKIITSATAYELLGKDFRYKTEFGYMGKVVGKTLEGAFYILPSGDPTLGSWRWAFTKDSNILGKWSTAIDQLKVSRYGGIKIFDSAWLNERIPDGWIWQDIGNYYGAGAGRFNWRENQYDVVLKSGSEIGSPVQIVDIRPKDFGTTLQSYVLAAAKGTGDNAYVYYPLQNNLGVLRGSIPINEEKFVISASQPNPASAFMSLFAQSLSRKNIGHFKLETFEQKRVTLHTHYSPSLDSITYWFLKKSINLYGEALIKTLAQKDGFGSTRKGVEIVKNFWKERDIAVSELNIVDGSGLSPLNRVTTHAQVTILQYAKKQSWFNGFYDALPEYNGMKIKSGTINGAKGFCGYHTSKDGNEYIFSFLVNNYNGSASRVVQKMYTVLDVLK